MSVKNGLSTIKCDSLVMVYHKIRGKMQPIRNLLSYLQLNFIQIYWGDDLKHKLPQDTINSLKGVKIDKSALPLLVYQGHLIYDSYPIMAYLCRRFQRQDLLGTNIMQRSRLQQILEIFLVRQPNSMSQLFHLAEICADISYQHLLKYKIIYIKKFFNQSGYLKQICLLLQLQQITDTFILGSITILDFLFLESCHYMLGMFNDVVKQEGIQDQIIHLDTMRNFLEFMYKQNFYLEYKKYLEQFSIIGEGFNQNIIIGLKKIWCLNESFIR